MTTAHLRLTIAGLFVGLVSFAAPARPALPDTPTLRGWVEEMKNSQRGPFARIRWFCADGTVQPPKAYACADHGGGIQHGEWSDRVKKLRADGYRIANVLASLEPDAFTGADPDVDLLRQIVLERFLIEFDDGWIFRGARTYRGALQIEDEEAGARTVMLAMLADPGWRRPSRYLLLRELVRLLPLQQDEGSASDVRRLALEIAERDESFTPLRAKIHNQPDADDAGRVREYAATSAKSDLADEYVRLADMIDTLYKPGEAAGAVRAVLPRIADPESRASLDEALRGLERAGDPASQLNAASRLLARMRDAFPGIRDPEVALAFLQSTLAVEDAAFAAGNQLVPEIDPVTRRQRLAWLQQSARALYGAGLITRREADAFGAALLRFATQQAISVERYQRELRYLARIPEWASGQMRLAFGDAQHAFDRLEPLAHMYPQDRLRGSPLLFYTAIIDSLVRDANGLAGIEHDLFGERIGAGLRALNPGLARGVLRAVDPSLGEEQFQPDGIYLLPETTSDLPRVAGILTRGEGNSLSHVQLLARNLGIPNVVVGNEMLAKVNQHLGEPAALAVSPNGVVQLVADGPRWDAVFGADAQAAPDAKLVIRPDLEKLDIGSTRLIPLADLRAADSGKLSGPKGANLGELKHYFGPQIPDGFVIPFGVFRKLLDQPLEAGGPSVFDWMVETYDRIQALEGQPDRQEEVTSRFLARLRAWIESSDPGPAFRRELRAMLDARFGTDGSYGVFVRSDTNVEDLPGFTGAGLNLTVPYVVGYENIEQAIRQVWASPFTERAFGWRQHNMEQPEYVFPAVVVQLGFPAEKSGVMVTTDVDEGEPGWISLAISEGVGGAVEGQAAESLRVNLNTGEVRLLAQATAAERTVLSPSGGIDHVPSSGNDTVLQPAEIDALLRFARDVPSKFPELRDENGRALPADVEFAFKNGELALLQIRPFVESKSAQRSQYLASLDEALEEKTTAPVPLDAVPAARR